jgi:hypothetical protein
MLRARINVTLLAVPAMCEASAAQALTDATAVPFRKLEP